MWTSANDKNIEGTWVWGQGGGTVPSNMWNEGEPNNGGGENR